MLHLINNIFLCPDTALDTKLDRVVISNLVGHDMDPYLDETAEGYLYGYGHNYSDVIGDGKAFSNLLNLLEFANQRTNDTKSRFVIYADQPNFIRVAVNFYRAMLPNATSADIYDILRRYQIYTKQKIASGSGLAFTSGRNTLSTLDALTCTRAQVEEAYTNSNIDSNNYTRFFQANIHGCDIEYICASYAATGRSPQVFADMMRKFLAVNFFLVCVEVKTYITRYITEKNFRCFLGFPADYDIDQLEGELVSPNSPTRVLFLPAYWYPLQSMDGNAEDMTHGLMDRISVKDFQTLVALTTKVMTEWDTSFGRKADRQLWDMVQYLPQQDWTGYAPSLLAELSRQLNEEVAADAVGMSFLYWILGADNQQGRISPYLLQYVFEQYSKNKDTLQGFVVNGI